MDIEEFEKKYRATVDIFKKEKSDLAKGVTISEKAGILSKVLKAFEEIITYAVAKDNLCKEDETLNAKINKFYENEKINDTYRDKLHNLRKTRNDICHPNPELTREQCGQFLKDVEEVRDTLAPYDKGLAKKWKKKSDSGTLEYAKEKTEKLKYWLNPNSKHSSAIKARETLAKRADFFRFALKQGYFFSHEVGDFYGDSITIKTRGNIIGRWSRDGWIYTSGEKSTIIPGSKKYYFNPDIEKELEEFCRNLQSQDVE